MKKYFILLVFFGCISSFAQKKELLLKTYTFKEVEKKNEANTKANYRI